MTQETSEQLTTAKYREEAPSKRVGRVETQLGTKQTHGTIFKREGCRRHRKWRETDSLTGESNRMNPQNTGFENQGG